MVIKRFVAACLALLMTMTAGVALAANSDGSLSQDAVIQRIKPPRNWLKWVWQALKFGTSNIWFDVPGVSGQGLSADYVSTGVIKFNAGDYGPVIRHDIELLYEDHHIDAFGKTYLPNFPGRLVIIVTDPSGNDVITKTVTTGQHVYVKPEDGYPLGTYTIRYVNNDSQSWNLWLYLWHFHEARTCDPRWEVCPDETVVLTDSLTGRQLEAVLTDGDLFITPSAEHLAAPKMDLGRLTLAELELQLYDEKLQHPVEVFKNYNPGDQLKFEDTILSIRYDEEYDETRFGFADRHGNLIEWPFAGDLRDRFEVGQLLRLNFRVINWGDGPTQVLDYFAYGLENTGAAPKIDSYLALD